MEPGCSAMTFSESSHKNWTLIWYNLHRPQHLGDVDILVGKAPCLLDPLPTLSHGGYGEMVVERDGEKRRRRKEKERWEEPFYMSLLTCQTWQTTLEGRNVASLMVNCSSLYVAIPLLFSDHNTPVKTTKAFPWNLSQTLHIYRRNEKSSRTLNLK